MHISDIGDYILAQKEFGTAVTCGAINGALDACIGVYAGKDPAPTAATIGVPPSYGIISACILVRWGKSSNAAEIAAQRLYDCLKSAEAVSMGAARVLFTQMQQSAPVPVGRDEQGIYEYVINILVYFERSK